MLTQLPTLEKRVQETPWDSPQRRNGSRRVSRGKQNRGLTGFAKLCADVVQQESGEKRAAERELEALSLVASTIARDVPGAQKLAAFPSVKRYMPREDVGEARSVIGVDPGTYTAWVRFDAQSSKAVAADGRRFSDTTPSRLLKICCYATEVVMQVPAGPVTVVLETENTTKLWSRRTDPKERSGVEDSLAVHQRLVSAFAVGVLLTGRAKLVMRPDTCPKEDRKRAALSAGWRAEGFGESLKEHAFDAWYLGSGQLGLMRTAERMKRGRRGR